MSNCLSPPRGLGCAPADGQAVHKHDDGSWWFWLETWCDEWGPYATEAEALAAVASYCKEFLLNEKEEIN